MKFNIYLEQKETSTLRTKIVLDKVNIKHLRATNSIKTVAPNGKIGRDYPVESKGGFTVISFIKNDYPIIITSRCSSKENFCRKIGIVSAVYNYVNRHLAKNGPCVLLEYILPSKEDQEYTFFFSQYVTQSNPLWFLHSKKGRGIVRPTSPLTKRNQG